MKLSHVKMVGHVCQTIPSVTSASALLVSVGRPVRTTLTNAFLSHVRMEGLVSRLNLRPFSATVLKATMDNSASLMKMSAFQKMHVLRGWSASMMSLGSGVCPRIKWAEAVKWAEAMVRTVELWTGTCFIAVKPRVAVQRFMQEIRPIVLQLATHH